MFFAPARIPLLDPRSPCFFQKQQRRKQQGFQWRIQALRRIDQRIAEYIRAALHARHLSIGDAARGTGIELQRLQRLLRGERYIRGNELDLVIAFVLGKKAPASETSQEQRP